MRVVDRDLIRGGHYGQRSCEPHSKAEHMAAPIKPANVKKALANSEPSTHGNERPSLPCSTKGRYQTVNLNDFFLAQLSGPNYPAVQLTNKFVLFEWRYANKNRDAVTKQRGNSIFAGAKRERYPR